MIHSLGTDIEIFQNLFSATFVNLQDYLRVFKDCEGKSLTECLTVAEIESRLDKVKSDIFYISDTDDSQLLSLVEYINSKEAHFDENGNPVRYDVFGYNNQAYDDMMFKAFMMYFNRFDNTKQLIAKLKEVSDKIISLQDDKDAFWKDRELDLIRKYPLPWATVDLFKVYALNSAGVNVDKDTGERKKFGKSLKQVSINLKWHNLLDFKLPPIDDEEGDIYRKKDAYRGMTNEQLNHLITNDFDRYILPKYVKPMLHYNKNDVYLVCEIARQKPDEIKLRYSLGAAFNLNLLCAARSSIADKLLYKFYSERSGLSVDKFKDLRTQRTALSFNKIIFPHICFKTKQLQDLLEDMKKVVIYRTNKDAFEKVIQFYGTTYTIATGGLHSQDRPAVLTSTDKYTYVHYDISSFYPSVMVAYNIAPKHLNNNVFVKMVDYFRLTRIKCKHTKDEDGLIVTGVHNKLAAEALKIVINAIYGKFGFEMFFLFDRFAQMQVTINGQLMVMMVVEALELDGIHVVSANTDGIIVKLPKDKEEDFKRITDDWCAQNKLSADSERYKLFVTRDINNYFDIQSNDKVEYKGGLDPKQYLKDLKKGYDMPVVAKAVFEYFAHGISVMETLRNHKDILDFCKTQNVGKQFEVVYQKVENGKVIDIHSQRHVRFYVSTKGVIIMKENVNSNQRSVLASGKPVIILNKLDDKDISLRNIDYKYYYEEAYKIINPIKLGISPNQKGDKNKKTLSGKALLKKNFGMYNSLFDNEDMEQ
nr:MAG TPA: DNA polymerase [Crassvirales sp.]